MFMKQEGNVFENPLDKMINSNDTKQSDQTYPQTIGSRKNGFPAVIIIHQVTKEKSAFSRKKSLEDFIEKREMISKLDDISMIDEDDGSGNDESATSKET